ncbi:MAG: response regulator [Planctomycetota bacterium]
MRAGIRLAAPRRSALLLLLVCGLSIRQPLRAQGAATTPESFLVDAGLERGAVHAAAFAPDGRLWLATSEGLLAFDGVCWSRFATDAGLPGSLVTAVAWHGDELWIGTEHGAGRMHAGRFVAEGPVTDRRVRRLAVSGTGDLWLCATGVVYRRRGSEWERMLAGERIVDVAPLGDGDLILVGEDRLLRVGDGMVDLPLPPHLDLTQPLAAAAVQGGMIVAAGGSLWTLARTGAGVVWRPSGFAQRQRVCAVLRTRDGRTVAFAAAARRFVLCTESALRPLSGEASTDSGLARGIVEAQDGSLWAFGDGLLLRMSPPGADPRVEMPPPRLIDTSGRVWFADAQRVAWRRGRDSVMTHDLALPIVVGSDYLVARSRDSDNTVVIQGDEKTVLPLPFRASGRLRMLVDGADVTWAVQAEGPVPQIASLEPGDGWRPSDLHGAVGSDYLRARVSADRHDGLWLALPHEVQPLVHVSSRRGPEPLHVPEPLADGDVVVDGQDRLWVVGASGPWSYSRDRGWRPHGDRWTQAVAWIRAVGDRIVLGCARCQDGAPGIVVVGGDSSVHHSLPAPRLLGEDTRGLYVAGGNATYLVAASGSVTALAGLDARDLTSIVVDRDLRAWLGHRDRTVSSRDLPPPHAFFSLAEPSPFAGEAFDVRIDVAHAYVPRDRMQTPCATLAWRIDGGVWTPERSAPRVLRLDGLPAGRHGIDLLARDAFGRPAPLRTLSVDVRAKPLQDRAWFPAALAGIVALVTVLAAFAMVTSRRLMRQTERLRAAVKRRTHKIRSELFRRRRAERHLRHQHRVLGLLATGKPIEQALGVLLRGLEERLPRWRGAICLVDGDRLSLAAAPSLSASAGAVLDGLLLVAEGCPCACAVRERRVVVQDATATCWDQEASAAGVHTVYAQPILSSSGAALGVLVLLRDVAGPLTQDQSELVDAAAHIAAVAIESKRGEVERFELQQEVLNAQKLRSLGLLAGGIAHDFNNLLTGVLGYAGLARMQTITGSPVDEALAQVEMASERAAELCAQLLAYSGRGRFVVKPVDLSELVAEMTRMLRLPVSRNVALELNLVRDLPAIEADATQVRQVVMNLITNAADAVGDARGEITVETGVAELDAVRLRKVVVGREIAPGRYTYAEVRDTGCGMNDATRRNVFEPFFSTKATGRGLGMAAVHGIVQGHRGAIELDTGPGRGTTIRVFFPASDKPAEASRQVVVTPDLHESGMVLVAEDDRVVRELAQAVLADSGFQVIVAGDGVAASRILDDARYDFRVVLLDIAMPRRTGFEVLAALRQQGRDLPVVLTSGNEMADASEIARDPHTHFLQKPYGPHALLQVLRRALGVNRRGAARGSRSGNRSGNRSR